MYKNNAFCISSLCRKGDIECATTPPWHFQTRVNNLYTSCNTFLIDSTESTITLIGCYEIEAAPVLIKAIVRNHGRQAVNYEQDRLMGISEHLIVLIKELYTEQEATAKT
ncbi:hypothetical protein LAZ67_X003684 [Cordylochernes scorpioides]|uniref:Uncharacterized protein n=1 Tax=Cordylochernes scorpioides TaxID=51811 RepID=A0ABY6LUT3_9ARAC|nr:hypothetical protein LAZ67_X003684 [Cordylochernes scorpioides]